MFLSNDSTMGAPYRHSLSVCLFTLLLILLLISIDCGSSTTRCRWSRCSNGTCLVSCETRFYSQTTCQAPADDNLSSPIPRPARSLLHLHHVHFPLLLCSFTVLLSFNKFCNFLISFFCQLHFIFPLSTHVPLPFHHFHFVLQYRCWRLNLQVKTPGTTTLQQGDNLQQLPPAVLQLARSPSPTKVPATAPAPDQPLAQSVLLGLRPQYDRSSLKLRARCLLAVGVVEPVRIRVKAEDEGKKEVRVALGSTSNPSPPYPELPQEQHLQRSTRWNLVQCHPLEKVF